MSKYWAVVGIVAIAGAIGLTAVRCTPSTSPPQTQTAPGEPSQPDSVSADPAEETGAMTGGEALPVQAAVEIDIGDVTYGVYANIEIMDDDILPNMNISRLSSPRFDHRTQLLTIDIAPPHPYTMPLVMMYGSTRPLMGHTVYLKVHTFREYLDSSGETITDQVLSFDLVLGDQRLVRVPELRPFDAFEGLMKLPSTMLVYAELEAWLFLSTNVNTFDPESANFDSADYKRYSGFNPARINLLGMESEE